MYVLSHDAILTCQKLGCSPKTNYMDQLECGKLSDCLVVLLWQEYIFFAFSQPWIVLLRQASLKK